MKADGSIVVEAIIDDKGFVAGSKELEAAAQRAANSVEGIGKKAEIALQKHVVAFSKMNQQVAAQQDKVRDLEKQLNELSGQTVETDEYKNLTAEISKLDNAINRADARKRQLLEFGGNESNNAFKKLEYDTQQMTTQMDTLLAKKRELESSGFATVAVDTSAIEKKLAAEREKLTLMNDRLSLSYQELNTKVDSYKKKLFSADGVTKSLSKSTHRFGSRLREIISGALVFNIISSGLRSLTSHYGAALKSNNEFSSALAKLKGALYTAFQPIYEAVLPALITLMRILTAVIQVIGQFFAAISGKSYGQMAKNAKALNDQAKAIGGVGDAAKDAQKDLYSFDEINRQSDVSTSSGGGGSAVGGSAADFDWLGEVEERMNRIAKAVLLIGAALPLWKISSSLPGNLGKISGALSGILISVGGLVLEWDALSDAWENGVDWGNLFETVAGGGGIVAGGAMIGKALGSAVLGGAIGAIIAGIPAFVVGIKDAIANGLNLINASLTAIGATATGAGIGAIIGMIGGPIGAGIGALIGLAVGLITDLGILIYQKWDEICAFFAPVAEWFDVNVIQPISNFFSGLWDSISQWGSDCWENIKEFFSPAIEWFSELWGSVSKTIEDIFYNIGVIAEGCWETITIVWGIFSEWFDETVIQPVARFFSNLWNDISSWAISAWEDIRIVFSKIASWMDEHIIQPVAELFTGLWEDITIIFGDVAGFFRGILNGIISALNSALSWIFGGVNNILGDLREFNIAGYTPFSEIRLISVPQIPYLAQGAVIPPNAPFAAVLGDQRHGTNIEAPLDTIKQAVAEVLRQQGFNGGDMDVHITFEGDVSELIRYLEPKITAQQRIRSRAMGV